MNILDIIILLCMLPVLISGYKKGMIPQVISIISLIAGVWTASELAGTVGEWIRPMIEGQCDNPAEISFLAGFAIVLVAVCIITGLIGWILEVLTSWIIPYWIDKPCGLVLSLASGTLLMCTLYLLFLVLNRIYFFTDFKTSFFTNSTILPYIESLTKDIFPDILTIFG